MSRAFKALVWKESRQIWRLTFLAAVGIAAHLYLTIGMGSPTGEYQFDNDSWFHPFLIVMAGFMGYGQTDPEAEGDGRAFAFHRPASGAQIFWAKFVSGVAVMIAALIIGSAVAMVVMPIVGFGERLRDLSYWVPTLTIWCASLVYYAAGLYGGARRGPMLKRCIGFGVALLGSAVTISPSLALTVLVSGALAIGVAVSAKRRFTLVRE